MVSKISLLRNFIVLINEKLSQSDIQKIELHYEIQLPEEVKDFYLTYGIVSTVVKNCKIYSDKSEYISDGVLISFINSYMLFNTFDYINNQFLHLFEEKYLFPMMGLEYSNHLICIGLKDKYKNRVFIYRNPDENSSNGLITISNSIYDFFLFWDEVEGNRLHNLEMSFQSLYGYMEEGIMAVNSFHSIQTLETSLCFRIPIEYVAIWRNATGKINPNRRDRTTILLEDNPIQLLAFIPITEYENWILLNIQVFKSLSSLDFMAIAMLSESKILALGFGFENYSEIAVFDKQGKKCFKKWCSVSVFTDELVKN